MSGIKYAVLPRGCEHLIVSNSFLTQLPPGYPTEIDDFDKETGGLLRPHTQ